MPEVNLTLQAGGGPTYTAQTYPSTYPQTTYPQTYPPPNNTYPQNGVYQGSYPYNTWAPARVRPRGPSNALWLGIDAAATIPFDGNNINQDLGSAGGAVGVDVGLRLARIIYLGAQIQGSFFGGDGMNASGAQSFLFAALFGLMSNPKEPASTSRSAAGSRTLIDQHHLRLHGQLGRAARQAAANSSSGLAPR